jgi:hypothetical protein
MKLFRQIMPVLVFVCVTMVSASALGQAMRGTGSLTLDPLKRELGLNAGAFKIFPTLGLGYSFNSNLFNSDDTAWESPTSAQMLRIGPGLRIASKNPQNVALDLSAAAHWDQYFGDSEAVTEQSNLGADMHAKAAFFQQSAISLVLEDRFRRALERRGYESTKNFNRNVNAVGAGIVFKPGGGALELKAGYAFNSDFFTDMNQDWGDLLFHEVKVNGSWKFFPFTALVLDANWQVRNYLADGQGRYGELTDSTPLRVRVGLNGFITKKLSAMILVGYGNSMHDKHDVPAGATTNPNENDSFNMAIGEARISYKFSPNTIVQGGYRYDFADSIFSNYSEYHRINVNFLQRIANRVDLEVDLAYVYRVYAQLPRAYFEEATDPAVKASLWGLLTGYDRVDSLLLARLKAKVDITRFLAFEATYDMELNNDPLQGRDAIFGTCVDAPCNSPNTFRDYVGFKRHVILGSLVLRY